MFADLCYDTREFSFQLLLFAATLVSLDSLDSLVSLVGQRAVYRDAPNQARGSNNRLAGRLYQCLVANVASSRLK